MRGSTRAAILALAAAITGLLVGSMAVAKGPPAPPTPTLTFDQASWDFGWITVGDSPTKEFTLTYTGKGSSGKITVTLDPATGPFSISANGCAKGISANKTCKVTVSYAPGSPSTADTAKLKASTSSLTSSEVPLLGAGVRANQAPTADSGTANATLGEATTITLTGSDSDNDNLTFAIADGPSHGSAVLDATSLDCPTTDTTCSEDVSYTPAESYTGPDSFTFKVNDGRADSAAATISITVWPPENQAPTADDQPGLSVNDDTTLTITLAGSDPDGDDLTFAIVQSPGAGSLDEIATPDCTAGGCTAEVVYTPAAVIAGGTDSFMFKVNDGENDSNTATVSITITHVNQAPTADPKSGAAIGKNSPDNWIQLSGSDPENDELSFTIATDPAHGTLALVDESWGCDPGYCYVSYSYTPTAGYVGDDSFTYTANDGQDTSEPATVSLTVEDTAPWAGYLDPVQTPAGESVTISLTGGDENGDQIDFVIDSGPSNGTLVPSDSKAGICTGVVSPALVGVGLLSTVGSSCSADFLYTPNEGFSGTDQITFYTEDDNNLTSGDPTTVYIDVAESALPGLSIDDPSFSYGTTLTFTVTMSETSATDVSFDWETADGTAVSGTTCSGFDLPNDYIGGSGTETITAGSTSTTIVIETCSTGPGNYGGDDTNFTVTISNPSGATITDDTGIGTLIAT